MIAGTHWVVCKLETVPVVNVGKLLYDRFRTGGKYNNAPYNYYHFTNASIDIVLDDMVEATTLEEVKQYAREACILLAFEQPQIPIYYDPIVGAYRNDRFDGFFEFKGLGWITSGNWACATKVHLKEDLGGSLGGTFYYCLSGNMNTLNPYLQRTKYEQTVFQYIYEKLWNIDPNTWETIPGLAYAWDIEPTTANGDIRAGQKFTFYLYENETWHDGHPFTAADVNHSLHMWRASPYHGPEMWDIYKVVIPDDYTIEFYVNETGYFEWVDTTNFYITPKHIWQNVANVTTYSPPVAEVIGTGPYKLDTWVPGEYISLLRHEDWRWDIRDVPELSLTTTIPVDCTGCHTYPYTPPLTPTYPKSIPSPTTPGTGVSSTLSSNTSIPPEPPLDLLPVLQMLELGTVLFFVVTLVVIVRRQRMG
jgi:ABC-type transport system substrate-binding protein